MNFNAYVREAHPVPLIDRIAVDGPYKTLGFFFFFRKKKEILLIIFSFFFFSFRHSQSCVIIRAKTNPAVGYGVREFSRFYNFLRTRTIAFATVLKKKRKKRFEERSEFVRAGRYLQTNGRLHRDVSLDSRRFFVKTEKKILTTRWFQYDFFGVFFLV